MVSASSWEEGRVWDMVTGSEACDDEKNGGRTMLVILRKALIVTVVLVALLALWIVLLNRWANSIAPGGETLAECLAKMPEPARIEVFTQDGQEYLLLWGETQAFPRAPSGPPMYVFDRTGKLVDWVADSGDTDTWWKQWPGLTSRQQISRDKLMRWPGATQ